MDYYLMRLDVDVVLIITPKRDEVTQVFKNSPLKQASHESSR